MNTLHLTPTYDTFVTVSPSFLLFFFFFNDTATTEIYTLSLHDALPILGAGAAGVVESRLEPALRLLIQLRQLDQESRSEEHTSELQSRQYLVCRLLLEKKKEIIATVT